ADAILEDNFHLFDVLDVRSGIAVNDDQVRSLASGNGADAIRLAEELRSVRCDDADGFNGRESGFNEQLRLALVAEPRQHATVAGGILAGQQQTAGLDEVALE